MWRAISIERDALPRTLSRASNTHPLNPMTGVSR
jgi:hypothetical protein